MEIPNGYGIVRYVFHLVNDPDDMVVTHGLALADAPSAGVLLAIYDAFNDNMTPWLNDQYEFRGITVQGKTGAGVEYQEELFVTGVGGSAGPALPQNCAVLVQKRTGLAGRKNRGRMYLPGFGQEGEVASNGVISTTLLGGLQTAATAWYDALDALTGGAGPVVVLHGDGSTPTVVAAFVVDDIIATQRTRLR